jgi:hypothetical protein
MPDQMNLIERRKLRGRRSEDYSRREKELSDSNDWRDWSKFVIKGLESLNTRVDAITQDIINLRIELTTLKTKASLFGLFGGIIASVILKFVLDAMLKGTP